MGVDIIMSNYGDFEFNTNSPTYREDYAATMLWITATDAGFESVDAYLRHQQEQQQAKLEYFMQRHYDPVATEPSSAVLSRKPSVFGFAVRGLIILLASSFLAVDANAAYYWERTRNTHLSNGDVYITDPSSPASIGAQNYKKITGLRCTNACTADIASSEVLSVAHTMPSDTLIQNSEPVKMVAMPAAPVQSAPLDFSQPVVLAPTTVMASDSLKPVAARGHYLPNFAPQYVEVAAPEAYSNTTVSPGYGYSDGIQDPDTLMPLQ